MRRTRFLPGVILAACASHAAAQSAIELSASSPVLSPPVPTVEASVTLGNERLLGDTGAVRWGVEAHGSASTTGTLAGSFDAAGELSRVAGQQVTIGLISVGASVDSMTAAVLARGEIGASLVWNGDLASFTVSPWLAGQAFVDPLLEAGAEMRLSLLAGSLVIEPGTTAVAGMTSAAEWSVTLEPGVGFSWYPAIPLQVTLGARWTGVLGAGGLSAIEWGGEVALSGALLSAVLFTGSATFLESATGASGTADAEVSLQLWSHGERWVSLPLRVSAAFSEQSGPEVSAALGVRFAW